MGGAILIVSAVLVLALSAIVIVYMLGSGRRVQRSEMQPVASTTRWGTHSRCDRRARRVRTHP